jgi:hypothetical protein
LRLDDFLERTEDVYSLYVAANFKPELILKIDGEETKPLVTEEIDPARVRAIDETAVEQAVA